MIWKIIKKLISVLLLVVGILFIVYFWNLDQKVVAWLYTMVHRIFDRKHVDVKF